jgi:adenosine deaminase
MRYEELLHRLPKVELHCHLIGSMRAETAADLARKHGIQLPHDAHFMYEHVNSHSPVDAGRYANTRLPMTGYDLPPAPDPSFSLFQVSDWVAPVLRDQADFARVVYESMVDAATSSNVRYREIAFEPSMFFREGISYTTIVDGLVEGVRAAERDAGIVGRLIGGLDRGEPPQGSVEVVEQMLANPRDEVIGIGLQAYELAGPPELFAEAYQLAGRGGLHRTAHAGEHEPSAKNVLTCLDLLGCDRIDHGYFVLEDDAAVTRCRDQGVMFACIGTSSRRAWIPWRRASIKLMVESDLKVSIASDDPAMFPTTVSEQYAILATELGFEPETMLQIAQNGIDGAWTDDATKQRLRDELTREYAALLPQLDPTF